ncbi:MAG: response regulator [Candidatus Hydrogenedentota bacterium]
MAAPNKRAARILLVEDNPADQHATLRAFKKSKLCNEVSVVEDGRAALDYLLHEGEYAAPNQPPRPDLILLDLNLPKLDGRQVIETLKAHAELKIIPVVVLTTSSEEEDIVRSYGLGVNSFVTKPVEAKTFVKTVLELEHYWMQIVVLPPNNP